MRLLSLSLLLLLLMSTVFTSAYAQENISAYKIVEPGESLNKALSSVPLFGSILKDGSVSGKILIVRKNDKIEVELHGVTKEINSRSSSFKFNWKKFSVSVDLDKLKASTKQLSSDSGKNNYELLKLFDSELLNDEITALTGQVSNLEKQTKEFQAASAKSADEKQAIEKTLAGLQTDFEDLQTKHSEAQNQLTQKTAQLAESDGKIAKASENNSKRISELKTLSSSLTQTINYQKDEIENLKSKLTSFESTKADNDNSLAEYQARIAELEKEISSRVARVQELEAELSTRETSSSEINQDELNNLKTNLESATQEANEMRNKIVGLESQINELTTKNNTISKELAEAKSKAGSPDEIKLLKTKIEELENDVKTANLALKQTEEKNVQLSQAVAALASGSTEIKIPQTPSKKSSKKVYECAGTYQGKNLVNDPIFGYIYEYQSEVFEPEVLVVDINEKSVKFGVEIQDGVIKKMSEDDKMTIEDKSDGSVHVLDLITGNLTMPSGEMIRHWNINCKPKETL